MTQEDTFPAQPSWAERHGQYRALRPQPLRKAANSECITLHEMSVFPNMLMLLFFQSTAPNWRMPRVGPLLQPGAGHERHLPAVQFEGPFPPPPHRTPAGFVTHTKLSSSPSGPQCCLTASPTPVIIVKKKKREEFVWVCLRTYVQQV
ncbi:uncharacterized protein [Anas acuta]|uniref:uncharacterized protein isoform X6 n=1 Tax=Anas acuta TaxID=28680 RepID=UPI0035C935F6